MTQYIDKAVVVAEIEKLQLCTMDEHMNFYSAEAQGEYNALSKLENFLDTLEVKEVDLDDEQRRYLTEHFNVYEDNILQSKRTGLPLDTLDVIKISKHFFGLGLKAQSKDIIEALRTEYEKGRADVIADTLSWLENCWPKYCSNQTIIEGFKEAIKGE